MNTLWPSVLLLAFTHVVVCRDFYLGMFRRNDFLVAQDVLYKAAPPFGSTTATYGRLFKCPITYFRVVDRLGLGRGPITTIVRGGLKKNYITVRIKSKYRLPVSVNIYVGCENKQPSTFRTTSVTLNTAPTPDAVAPDGDEPQRITFPDSNEDDKSKTTDQTPDKEQDGEEGKKDTDGEKKDDDTATTVKENNDDANNEGEEGDKEEGEPNNEEAEE